MNKIPFGRATLGMNIVYITFSQNDSILVVYIYMVVIKRGIMSFVPPLTRMINQGRKHGIPDSLCVGVICPIPHSIEIGERA
jgi:hypothetical protein